MEESNGLPMHQISWSPLAIKDVFVIEHKGYSGKRTVLFEHIKMW